MIDRIPFTAVLEAMADNDLNQCLLTTSDGFEVYVPKDPFAIFDILSTCSYNLYKALQLITLMVPVKRGNSGIRLKQLWIEPGLKVRDIAIEQICFSFDHAYYSYNLDEDAFIFGNPRDEPVNWNIHEFFDRFERHSKMRRNRARFHGMLIGLAKETLTGIGKIDEPGLLDHISERIRKLDIGEVDKYVVDEEQGVRWILSVYNGYKNNRSGPMYL